MADRSTCPRTPTNRRHALGATAVALSLLAGACSSDADGGATSSTTAGDGGAADTAGAEGPPSATFAWQVPDGALDDAVEQLPAIVETAMDETGVPGIAVAVVHGDEVVYAEGFGVRDVDTDEPVDSDTVFQLASLSKPLGATVVARAVDEGTVAWEDPVVTHLPGFELSDPTTTATVTIEDMYSHRSGLPSHVGDLLEDIGYDQQEVFDRLRFVPLEPIRSVYHYTNFGMTAGGEAVAAASGSTWADLSEQSLYEPLGMTSTSSRFEDYEAAENRAVTHVEEDGEWVSEFVRDADAQSPAGGVSSTVEDMAQWLRLVLANGNHDGEEIVSEDEIVNLRSPRMMGSPLATPDSRPGSYALGLNVGVDETARVRLSHSGAFALGAATAFGIVPTEDVGIVVLTNGAPIGVPEAIVAEFLAIAETGTAGRDWLSAYQQVFASAFEVEHQLEGDPPADPAPAPADEAIVGTYRNDYYGDAVVAAGPDGLVLSLGPEGAYQVPLTHWDGNVFSSPTEGENATGTQAVTFELGPDGTATAVTLEAFDREAEGEGDLGVFRR